MSHLLGGLNHLADQVTSRSVFDGLPEINELLRPIGVKARFSFVRPVDGCRAYAVRYKCGVSSQRLEEA